MTTNKVVRAIIEKDNKLLMVRKEQTDWYNLPGGKVEDNEKEEEAIKREINEELGVEVKEINYIGKTEYRIKRKIIECYLYSIKIKGEPWSRREIIEIKWQEKEKIKELRLGKSTIAALYLLSHK